MGDEKPEFDMMSTEEVAELFAVSKRTVARWVDDLGLPAYRLGGLLRFDRKEVVRWAERFHSQGDHDEDGCEGQQDVHTRTTGPTTGPSRGAA